MNLVLHDYDGRSGRRLEGDTFAGDSLSSAIEHVFVSVDAKDLVSKCTAIQFVVIIDEIGPFPQFMSCALCSSFQGSKFRVQNWCSQHEFLFVAAGTGANAGSASLDIEAKFSSRKAIVKLLRENQTVSDLDQNSRVAAIMYQWLWVQSDSSGWMSLAWESLGKEPSHLVFSNLLQTF